MNKFARVLIVAGSALGATAAVAGGYDQDGHYHESGNYHDHQPRGQQSNYGAYVGVNFGELRYREDGLYSITPAAALLRIGAPLGSNLALEARAGAGFGSASTLKHGAPEAVSSPRSLYAYASRSRSSMSS